MFSMCSVCIQSILPRNLTNQVLMTILWANIPVCCSQDLFYRNSNTYTQMPVMSLSQLFNDTAPFILAPRLIISIWDTHAHSECVPNHGPEDSALHGCNAQVISAIQMDQHSHISDPVWATGSANSNAVWFPIDDSIVAAVLARLASFFLSLSSPLIRSSPTLSPYFDLLETCMTQRNHIMSCEQGM